MVFLTQLSRDTALVHRMTKDSFSAVEHGARTFSLSVGDFAYVFESAEQGFFAALRRNFSFWHLFYYALECHSMDDFMAVMGDELDYTLDFASADTSVLYLGLEYFYQMLFDRYLMPVFTLLDLEFDHNNRIKILGKEGLVVWVSVN